MQNVFKKKPAITQKKFVVALSLMLTFSDSSIFAKEGRPSSSARSQKQAVNRARSAMYSTLRFFDGEGKEHSLKKASSSKPTLVIVWASWCGPCIKEMPSVERLKNSEFGKHINVIPIAIEKPQSGHLYSLNGITMPLYYSEKIAGFLAQEGLEGIPSALLYDERGNLVFKEVGAKEWDQSYAISLISKALNLSEQKNSPKVKRRR
jgi:thiol-disulfide isomerase/thioredoxin